MAVTLEIKFTGLFTFIPSSDGKELVVLLPRTGVLSPRNRVHQHHAFVIVERDHEPHKPCHPKHHPGCTQSARSGDNQAGPGHDDHADHAHDTAAQGSGQEKKKDCECIPFGRYRLVFTGLATGEHVNLPPAVVDLTPYVGPLDPKQLGSTPDDSVWAQVVLPGATSELIADDTAKWKIGNGKSEDMTHEVKWKTEVGTGARIEFWHLGGSKAGELELKPKDGEATILIEIEHLPHKDDRHEGEQCLDAPHFMAYYDLFGTTRDEPLPVLTDTKKVDDKHTCMTSRATLK